MEKGFFAFVSRMKYINRWALMRNTSYENLAQHSFEVSMIAHSLAVIGNERLNKAYNAERVALLGLYHDTPEIITGDMPTPVKYKSKEIRKIFGSIEKEAAKSLLTMLPEDMRHSYESLLYENEDEKELWKLVKAADKISALIKCIEERKAGNSEFSEAEKATLLAIHRLSLKEAEIFLEEFIFAYEMPLDKISKSDGVKNDN